MVLTSHLTVVFNLLSFDLGSTPSASGMFPTIIACTGVSMHSTLAVPMYLTLPYGEGVLPPSAEVSSGPNAGLCLCKYGVSSSTTAVGYHFTVP